MSNSCIHTQDGNGYMALMDRNGEARDRLLINDGFTADNLELMGSTELEQLQAGIDKAMQDESPNQLVLETFTGRVQVTVVASPRLVSLLFNQDRTSITLTFSHSVLGSSVFAV